MPPSSVTDRVARMMSNPRFAAAFPHLSPEEKAVINAYTDRQYLNLNKYLKGERFEDGHEKALEEISGLLSSALVKITPPHNDIAYRGCYMSPEEIREFDEALKNDTEVEHVYFTSSSRNPAKAFYIKKNAMKIIKAKEGKLIMDLSNYPEEEEVLFNKIGKFKVTDIVVHPDRHFVYMEEV
jgi:hypothetical protein